MNLPTIPNPRKMTLEEIEAERTKNAVVLDAEDAEIEMLRAGTKRARAEHAARVEVARAELATDLRVPRELLVEGLAMLGPNPRYSDPIQGPIWATLQSFTSGAAEDVNLVLATEARHVLAVSGGLPDVRSNDRAFGDPAVLRSLPPAQAKYLSIQDHWWADQVISKAGLSHSLYPPARPSDRADRDRVFADREAMRYDPGDWRRSDALADRELELLAERRNTQHLEASERWRRQGTKLRAEIVKLIDSVLAETSVVTAWWWLRQLRRIAAAERPLAVTSPDVCWKMSTALVEVPWTKLAKVKL